jgi:hypothetical protein
MRLLFWDLEDMGSGNRRCWDVTEIITGLDFLGLGYFWRFLTDGS